jgi:hypothetical protein
MACLLQLIGRIGNAVAAFVSRFVFSPTVWVGYAVVGLAILLWLTARFASNRGAGDRGERPAEVGATNKQVGPARRAPSGSAASPAAKGGDDEFADIEEILRRRGIS